MLSDLSQYFTKNRDIFVDEDEIVDVLLFLNKVHKYTKDEDIKNTIEVTLHDDTREMQLVDLLEYGFCSDAYLNDTHLSDYLNINFDNSFVTMILSMLMSTFWFNVFYEDMSADMMVDDGEGSYNLKNYVKCEYNRKFDRYLDKFILGELECYAYYKNEDGEDDDSLDEYAMQTQRIIVSYIHFKNKSLARKIRKAYCKNGVVRRMFYELGYHMVNGEFVYACSYNVEATGYYEEPLDMEYIYTGIETLRNRYLNDHSENQQNDSYKIALFRTNDMAMDCCENGFHENLMHKIMTVHCCSKEEVIL